MDMLKGPIAATIFIVLGVLILVWSNRTLRSLKEDSYYIAWRGFIGGTGLIIFGLILFHDYLKNG